MYASGGKNVPAGMAVVIVRESWLTSTAVHPMCPQVLDYRKTAGGRMPTPSIFQSLPNTPPIFAAYMLGLVLDDGEPATASDLCKQTYHANRDWRWWWYVWRESRAQY